MQNTRNAPWAKFKSKIDFPQTLTTDAARTSLTAIDTLFVKCERIIKCNVDNTFRYVREKYCVLCSSIINEVNLEAEFRREEKNRNKIFYSRYLKVIRVDKIDTCARASLEKKNNYYLAAEKEVVRIRLLVQPPTRAHWNARKICLVHYLYFSVNDTFPKPFRHYHVLCANTISSYPSCPIFGHQQIVGHT